MPVGPAVVNGPASTSTSSNGSSNGNGHHHAVTERQNGMAVQNAPATVLDDGNITISRGTTRRMPTFSRPGSVTMSSVAAAAVGVAARQRVSQRAATYAANLDPLGLLETATDRRARSDDLGLHRSRTSRSRRADRRARPAARDDRRARRAAPAHLRRLGRPRVHAHLVAGSAGAGSRSAWRRRGDRRSRTTSACACSRC